ncbi:hypothetical protein [Vibrio phage LP.1]|nr:hypothetical protein [Vibrio phage LP.1]
MRIKLMDENWLRMHSVGGIQYPIEVEASEVTIGASEDQSRIGEVCGYDLKGSELIKHGASDEQIDPDFVYFWPSESCEVVDDAH